MLPAGAVSAGAAAILKAWFLSPENFTHPYPTPHDIIMLMEKTGLEKKQVQTWFTNARRNIWTPTWDPACAQPLLRQQLQHQQRQQLQHQQQQQQQQQQLMLLLQQQQQLVLCQTVAASAAVQSSAQTSALQQGSTNQSPSPLLLPKKRDPRKYVKKCSVDGCTNDSRKGGVCVRHGAKVAPQGVCWRHGAKLSELYLNYEDKELQQVVDDAIQGKVGGMFSIDLTSLDKLPSTERAAKVILSHTAKRLASNDGNVNELERILYALRRILMLKRFKKDAIHRIVCEIADMQMKKLSPSDLHLASTIIKPSSNRTCTAGEFAFKKMRSQILAALAIFIDFRGDENRFSHLNGKTLLELIDWHDKHDEGAPSKIGQTSNERGRIKDDNTYPEDLFHKDDMVLGEGTAIARDELTEIEAFMAVYGNGKGTGVNLNLPRYVHGFGGRWYMMKSKKKSVLIHELERSIILFGPGKTPDELRRIYGDHHEDDGEEEEEWNEECEEEEEGEEQEASLTTTSSIQGSEDATTAADAVEGQDSPTLKANPNQPFPAQEYEQPESLNNLEEPCMPAEKRVEESEDIHSDDVSCVFTFSSDSGNDCFEGSHENEANGDGAAGDGDGSISPSSDLRMMLPASASVKRVSLGDDDIEGSDDATTAAAAAAATTTASNAVADEDSLALKANPNQPFPAQVYGCCVTGSATPASLILARQQLLDRCVAVCMDVEYEAAQLCPGVDKETSNSLIAALVNDLTDDGDNQTKRIVSARAVRGMPQIGDSPQIVKRALDLARANEENQKKKVRRPLWASSA